MSVLGTLGKSLKCALMSPRSGARCGAGSCGFLLIFASIKVQGSLPPNRAFCDVVFFFVFA